MSVSQIKSTADSCLHEKSYCALHFSEFTPKCLEIGILNRLGCQTITITTKNNPVRFHIPAEANLGEKHITDQSQQGGKYGVSGCYRI